MKDYVSPIGGIKLEQYNHKTVLRLIVMHLHSKTHYRTKNLRLILGFARNGHEFDKIGNNCNNFEQRPTANVAERPHCR